MSEMKKEEERGAKAEKKTLTMKKKVLAFVIAISLIVGYCFSLIPFGVNYNGTEYGNASHHHNAVTKRANEEVIDLFSNGGNLRIHYLRFSDTLRDNALNYVLRSINGELESIGMIRQSKNSGNKLDVSREELGLVQQMLAAAQEVCYKIKNQIPCVDDKYDRDAIEKLEDFVLLDKTMRDFYFFHLGPKEREEKGIFIDESTMIIRVDVARHQLENFRSEGFRENYLFPFIKNSSTYYEPILP